MISLDRIHSLRISPFFSGYQFGSPAKVIVKMSPTNVSAYYDIIPLEKYVLFFVTYENTYQDCVTYVMFSRLLITQLVKLHVWLTRMQIFIVISHSHYACMDIKSIQVSNYLKSITSRSTLKSLLILEFVAWMVAGNSVT